jgi:hypothetical protein
MLRHINLPYDPGSVFDLSCQPSCSYLAFYKAYQPLLVLNVEAYVGALALKGTDLSLAEITQEVSLHLAQLATMEEQLQGSVNLGLIQVNCNKVSLRQCMCACASVEGSCIVVGMAGMGIVNRVLLYMVKTSYMALCGPQWHFDMM